MVNINKVFDLINKSGLKKESICEQIGKSRFYLNDVKRGKSSMSEETTLQLASILGTSFEYLIDLTDDPEPNFIGRTAEALQDKVSLILASVAAMSDEEQKILHKLIALPDDERKRAMSVLSALLD